MPVDPEIRRLAANPEVTLAIKIIDGCFERTAEGMRKDAAPGLAADTAEAIIEVCWELMRRGTLRLYDPEIDDDDDLFVQEAVTPGQRARARVMGAKLFAVRQQIRRTARRQQSTTGQLGVI
jgi:hypothetical protein